MEIHSSIFTCFNPSRPKPWASVRFYFFFFNGELCGRMDFTTFFQNVISISSFQNQFPVEE